MKTLIVLLFICFNIAIAQPDLSVTSLAPCLSFPIHLIKVEHVKKPAWNHSDYDIPIIYGNADNSINLAFVGKTFVSITPTSGRPDSIFLLAGNDIIQCTIGRNDSALNWFSYYSFKMDSVLETRKASVYKVFGNIQIYLQIDSQNHSILSNISTYPQVSRPIYR
jgi:hypothetical protein